VGLQSRRGATVKALSFVDTRILSRASLLRSLKMYPYEKAVLKAEAGRRAHESCTRVGKVTDLQKKSGLLSKLLMLGKDNPEVDRAKKESKDRRCLSSMQRRIELSPAISPARTPRSGSKDIKMRGSLTQLPSSLQSSLQLPSAMSEFDNRRISNVGKMKIFGNKRMSISQGMGRTRRWSVCGSGGYAKQENISLCIMPPITVQESDYDSLSIISTRYQTNPYAHVMINYSRNAPQKKRFIASGKTFLACLSKDSHAAKKELRFGKNISTVGGTRPLEYRLR